MSDRRLTIAVAGGGIGGLTAAIALRRAGHHVTVFERSSFDNEAGAALTINPLGGRILQRVGVDFKQAGITNYLKTDIVHSQTLETLAPQLDHSDSEHKYGVRFGSVFRPQLHQELVKTALNSEGGGEPVKLVGNCIVKELDAETGGIVFQDGASEKADLIVAADGLHSTAGTVINGTSCPPLDITGTLVYRFTLPTKKILDNPETKGLLSSGPGACTFFVNPKSSNWLVRYYCSENEVCNFAFYVTETAQQADALQLRYKADRASLERELEDFHPAVRKVGLMADDVLPLWRLVTREPLPHLQKGRLVAIGDAAHPVLPYLGLGAVSAMEDAGALGALFDVKTFAQDEDVPALVRRRLELFEQLRKPRVAAYKFFSDVPMFNKSVDDKRKLLSQYMREEDMPTDQSNLRDWQWRYEVLKHVEEHLQQGQK